MTGGEQREGQSPKRESSRRAGRQSDTDETPGFAEPIPELSGQSPAGWTVDRPSPTDGLHDQGASLVGRKLSRGRFDILREIGAGGMGIVYYAHDHMRHEMIALKTLERLDPALLYRLKREFRTLVDVHHPNLVNLHELILDQDTWFFTMEFVEGVDFLTYVAASLAPPVKKSCSGAKPQAGEATTDGGWAAPQTDRLRHALTQLAGGLIALHDADKLHRDVKPSNTLVTSAGRLVLLDFGLATELHGGVDNTTHGHLLGTIAYMAPEQAAGLALSPAADWYSVGVMLYEALTGRLPFLGPPMVVLRDKQRNDPPQPWDLTAEVPEDLNALCMELLRREPTARPAGREVLARLARYAIRPRQIVATESVDLPFIGRREHLEELAEALSVTKRGRTVLVSVLGESGQGKSTLVQHFLDTLPNHGTTVVLKGRCYQQESLPYKAFDAVMDNLSRYLSSLSRLEVEALLPRDIGPLTHAFPVLRRVEAVAQAPRSDVSVPDQRELRKRAFAALRELLGRLGDRRPLVLYLDDLQWGDQDSASLLVELLKPPHAPVLLVLACCRSEDVPQSSFVDGMYSLRETAGSLLEWRELVVGPMSPRETRELTTELLKTCRWADQTHLQTVAGESGGVPFFVIELVQHLRTRSGDRGQLLSREQISLDTVLWCRIQELPEEARRLLEIVAVAGRPLEAAMACEAAGLGGQGRRTLDLLRSGRLLRGAAHLEQEEMDCCHDRIRDTILAHLEQDRLQEHHRRLALALEASGHADPEMLAVHFHGAGQYRQARRHYALAADQALEALAFENAARLFRVALDLCEGEEDEQGPALRIRLGDALASAGRGTEAARAYLSAAEVGRQESIELRRRAAMHLLTSGRIDEGVDLLRTVATAVGIRVPRTPFGSLCSLISGRLYLLLRGTGFHVRDITQVPAERSLRADVAYSASIGLSFVDAISGADFQTRAVLLALRTGDPYRIVRVLLGHAAHMAATGERGRRRAARLMRTLDAMAGRLGKPEAVGWVSLAEGVTASFEGKWRTVLQRCDHAVEIFRNHCAGVAWELNSAHLFSLLSLALLGEIAELRRRRAVLLEEARQRGDLYLLNGLCSSGLIIDRLAADDPDVAEEEIEEAIGQWTRLGFHIQHHGAVFGRTLIDLYRGNGAAAWRRVEESQRAYWYSLQRWVQQLRIGIFHARAWSALAACVGSEDPRPLLRTVSRAARRLERERIPYATAFARSIRAGSAAAGGDPEAAIHLLREAIERFDTAEMQLMAASARRRLGELSGGDHGREMVRQVDAWMQSQSIRNPSRMAAMYTPGFPPSE